MLIEGRLTWCIIILLVPIFGIIVYFVFVRRKPPRMHKKFYEKVRAEIKQYEVKYSQEDDYLKQNLGEYYGQFEYIYGAMGLKTYENTEVKYLNQGEVFFAELLSEIKKAKRYIFMEYFIIEQGKMWSEILKILLEKINAGVEVRVMYDDFGTISKLPSNFAKKLNKLGI